MNNTFLLTRYTLDLLPTELIDNIYSYIVNDEAEIIKDAFKYYNTSWFCMAVYDDNYISIEKYIWEKYDLCYDDYYHYDSDEEYENDTEIEHKIRVNYNCECIEIKFCYFLTFQEFSKCYKKIDYDDDDDWFLKNKYVIEKAVNYWLGI